MSQIISASIDLAKLEKAPVVQGKNGAKYVNITIIVNDEANQWGKDVSISLEQSKEERTAKAPKTFVGNGKVIYNNAAPSEQPTPQQNNDLPF